MRTLRIYKLFICQLPIAYCLFTSSCTQIDIFEKNISIPNYEWKHSFTANGSFIIKDTSSACNIYLVLRHTDAYRYNNIWLNIGLQLPGDTMKIQKVEILLSTDANGWEGTGMNDIWELRTLLNVDPRHKRFAKTGTYNFTINQIMRDDPLPNIMSVGLRIEKEKNVKN